MTVYERALVGVHGATKFLSAVMSGDRSSNEEVAARREVCKMCPYRVRKVAPGAVAESDWCGEPLVVTANTCGCLVAGKTLVASEKCPSGKW